MSDQAPQVRPGPGHNAPPAPIPLTAEQVVAWLEHSLAALISRRQEVVKALGDFAPGGETTIVNDQDQADAADLRKQAETLLRVAEQNRKTSLAPFKEATEGVNNWFKQFASVVQEAINPIREAMNVYARAVEEERRKKAEAEAAARRAEAERAEREAAEKLKAALQNDDTVGAEDAIAAADRAAKKAERAETKASAKPAELSRVTGVLGATASLRETVQIEIIDPAAVPRHLCTPDTVAIRAAVMKLWNEPETKERLRRGDQPYRGVRVTIKKETYVR